MAAAAAAAGHPAGWRRRLGLCEKSAKGQALDIAHFEPAVLPQWLVKSFREKIYTL
jgi:hypothetical protein